ncbi:unnamed protein product [Prunus armeniaca]
MVVTRCVLRREVMAVTRCVVGWELMAKTKAWGGEEVVSDEEGIICPPLHRWDSVSPAKKPIQVREAYQTSPED